jgi:hypothetical protein
MYVGQMVYLRRRLKHAKKPPGGERWMLGDILTKMATCELGKVTTLELHMMTKATANLMETRHGQSCPTPTVP